MPELPEVETTRRGINPHVENQVIEKVVVRNAKLRWPIDEDIANKLVGKKITHVGRRAKYLLLDIEYRAKLVMHLGMSGSLTVQPADSSPKKHDHFELQLSNNKVLRLNDPRRFGAVLWVEGNIAEHPLICHLGPEPSAEDFDASLLRVLSHKRKVTVKQFIMDGKVVVGVGNIYASESLFHAGIDPRRQAGKISEQRYEKLAAAIKEVISKAIDAGGTTLQDFTKPDGKPGYFKQELKVYGRSGEPCINCNTPISQITLGQRSTYFCKRCQT